MEDIYFGTWRLIVCASVTCFDVFILSFEYFKELYKSFQDRGFSKYLKK